MRPAWRHYAVLFGASTGLLALELAVSRTLSVALLSHYAFVAISLAMFGLGLAGLVVYIRPEWFPRAAVDAQLATYLGRFGLWSALADLTFLHIHVRQELSIGGFVTLSLAYLVLAVPFFFGGLCVSIVFTHFSAAIHRLYASDLLGASLGCLAAVCALGIVPAPVVPLGVAFAATAGALLLSPENARRAARRRFLAAGLLLALGLGTNLVRMRYVKVWDNFYSEYEAWNAFSRVSVIPNPELLAPHTLPLRRPPAAYTAARYPAAKWVDIDGTAWTPMFHYDGDPASIQFLRESVIYVVHGVRPNARVLIIGTGGGRDILAAKAYGQASVLGLELNPLMAHVVQDRFGDWSGRPYTLPGVTVRLGEARSTLAGIHDAFDVIQMSLVDTFAAGAAGGFVFAENYLYTVEAFRDYHRHLAPDGVLSVTRYFVDGYPLELMRLVRTASAAWRAEGASTAGTHLVVLAQGSVATMLAKRTPWTAEELAILDQRGTEDGMVMVYDPRGYRPGTDEILSLRGVSPRFLDSASVTTAPTTDDTPYFFNFIRRPLPHEGADPMRMVHVGNEALAMMELLLGTVTVLALVFFVAPLAVLARGRVRGDRRTVALLGYFVSIGFAFMMIEIPVLQRLVLFLGYPVYALAVGLFSLLLFCGLGSLASERVVPRPPGWLGGAIVGASLAYAALLPVVVEGLLGADVLLRVAVAVALLAPIGLLLGMAYPVGIRLLREHDDRLVPWAWGLNGATSVVASVVAVFVGARVGFTWALLMGAAAYALGFVALGVPAPAAEVVAGPTLAGER